MEFMNEEGISLLTDLYELTMAKGYHDCGKTTAQACFYIHFRENPFQGGYTIACGIEEIAGFVESFDFTEDDIAYLASLQAPGGGSLFDADFLASLRDMELTVDIDTVEEGSIVFPNEPVVRVTGPIDQCQILETALLNYFNFESLIATKAARVCDAAEGPVAEFGLRRAQGPNGGLLAARAAVIGGCASTSNVLAGKIFDIPVSGTHAHSWVMSFENELDAFRAYAASSPANCCLLVDTYNVEQGVRNAITVGHEMEARGERLASIRIDSGDLAWLSSRAREMLDEAGLPYVKIVASNNLEENVIRSLKEQGAPIDSWGVGTNLITARDCPALGGVYKLCAYRDSVDDEWEPRLKISGSKTKMTLPGILNIRRYYDDRGVCVGDMVYDERFEPAEDLIIDPHDNLRRKNLSGCTPKVMLKPLVRGGKRVTEHESVMAIRARVKDNLAELDRTNRRFVNPHSYPVGLARELHDTRDALVMAFRGFN